MAQSRQIVIERGVTRDSGTTKHGLERQKKTPELHLPVNA